MVYLGQVFTVLVALTVVPALGWAQNTPPVAYAGDDISVQVDVLGSLHGSAEDDDLVLDPFHGNGSCGVRCTVVHSRFEVAVRVGIYLGDRV